MLPQSPYGDSSLPEGAFWSLPLLQYETGNKRAKKAAVKTEAPSGRELAPRLRGD